MGGGGGRLMIDQHLKDVLRPEGKEGIREGGRGEVGGVHGGRRGRVGERGGVVRVMGVKKRKEGIGSWCMEKESKGEGKAGG